jgi:putative PIN family toxin of toxin-antitoxin system
VNQKVVFDTNIVVSALLFARGRLAWLRGHWRQKTHIALLSRATAMELNHVLSYPKFQLEPEERVELLGDYLPYCEIVESVESCPQRCRDPRDQPFLDLAYTGRAEVLVTGDRDRLALAGQTGFAIETPGDYLTRVDQS